MVIDILYFIFSRSEILRVISKNCNCFLLLYQTTCLCQLSRCQCQFSAEPEGWKRWVVTITNMLIKDINLQENSSFCALTKVLTSVCLVIWPFLYCFVKKKKFKLFYMLAPFSPVISFFLLLTRRLKPEFRVDTILSWWEKLWYGCLYQNFDATSWIRSCVVTTNEVFIK